MTRRLHILIAGCAAAVAVAEWLHGNAGSWAWTAGVAGLATAGLAVVRGPRTIASGLAALASLLLGGGVVAGVREGRRVGGWLAPGPGRIPPPGPAPPAGAPP